MARKVTKYSNVQEVQNAAKTLYANIRFASVDNPVRTVALTSSVPNEGKTITSYELAKAIAGAGQRTLIVDTDMRRRSLANVMNCYPRYGAYSVMAGQVALSQTISPTEVNNLFFLDVEPNIPNPADIISSRAFERLLAEIKEQFDFVVFDTPPVGTFVDAALLGRLVDGVVMVCKMGTKRADLVDAYEQLRKSGCNILGACATFCEGTGSEYYYSYYKNDKGFGKSKKKKEKKPELDPLPPLSTLQQSPMRQQSHVAQYAQQASRPAAPAQPPARPAQGAHFSADDKARYSAANYGSAARRNQ